MGVLVLINPPTSLEDRYGGLARGGSRLPPLGLALLAAIAREAGACVHIVDAEAEGLTPDGAVRRALELDPDVVGLTAVTMTVHAAAAVATRLKHAAPAVPIVLGGVHVSALPEDTLTRFPAFDVAAIGEGDRTLPELLTAFEHGTPLAHVNDIVYRAEDGALRRTAERETLLDLDSLPFPAWDLLPGFPDRYRPAANAFRRLPASSLVTSRGCPGRCTFCDRTVSGRRIRTFSAEYLMEMVLTLRDVYGVRELIFHDDNFTASRERLMTFCEMMRDSAPGIAWSATARIDMVTPESLAAMKQAGCWQLAYGIESGDQAILDSLCKGITLDRIRQVLKWTKDAGIEARGYFMAGVPDETQDTLARTIDFLLELPLDDFHMTIYTPYRGTPLGDSVLDTSTVEEDWRKFGDWEVVYVPPAVSAQQLESAQREAFRRFYARPRIIVRQLKRILRYPRTAGAIVDGFLAWLSHIRS